jgi:hypothetical protein
LLNDHAVEATALTLTLPKVVLGVEKIVTADGVHFRGERGFIYAAMVFDGVFEAPSLLRQSRRRRLKNQ